MQTASKKIVTGWAMYDWANSAYSLIITSAIFPAYYTAIAPQQVLFAGRTFDRSVLASYAISLSFLVIALLSPILSSIADYKGNKKRFMQFFCYLGSLACIGLTFLTKENIPFGIVCSIFGSIGYCGSIVFYNAYLPEIAAPEDQDRISARGFSLGYFGSVLLMIVCLAVIIANDSMGLGWGAWPARLSFLAVGLWWAGFAQITFRRLPSSVPSQQHPEHNVLVNGFYELRKVWRQLQHHPETKRFLRSFFFYNMGVQTVMYLATYFASDELKMESTQLILTVLIIQLVAIAGAMLFSRLSERFGNIATLGVIILVWIGICISAYYIHTANQFFLLAFFVGLVMGGIQSLSRSTYSKLLPPTKDTASFFSFYDVCDKVGTVLGTLAFGYVAESLGGMRNSVLALMVFFIAGGVLLLFVDMKRKNVIAI
ncbi:MFS transporter [Paraflavisolibacter sp. H34]|uniref:MFS transporter n=1 Tax=Huijunlia imazamoxiresistens TaxID=3127457 RepID=UPI003018485F